MSKRLRIVWAKEAGESDYAAAETYLSLLIDQKHAARVVKQMRKMAMKEFIARDILRAAGISPFGTAPSEEQRQQILAREPLAPVLLVRVEREMRLIVADGYHRVSTVYAFDQTASVPCKLVGLASPT